MPGKDFFNNFSIALQIVHLVGLLAFHVIFYQL